MRGIPYTLIDIDTGPSVLTNNFPKTGPTYKPTTPLDTSPSSPRPLPTVLPKLEIVESDVIERVSGEEVWAVGVMECHEQHLQANGASGHYVGDSVALVDVKTDYLINVIQGVTGEELVSEEETPAILRLKKELEKVERIAVQ
ncbi:hypothetical protein BGX30_014311 [Mortierella sp. GBA39]|nr:hypothetical protein BGX30_014311 [Mortierella sp. GBA39]